MEEEEEDEFAEGPGQSQPSDSEDHEVQADSRSTGLRASRGEIERIVEIVERRIEHLPLPDPDQAAQLREKAPELYHAYIRIAEQRAATESYVQRAPFEVPERLARSGRPWALTALIVVLAFCGYLASLGGAAQYIAGVIAAFDIVAMLALFFGLNPDARSSRSSRPEIADKEDKPASPEDNPVT
jgi:hypothetical protein